MSENKTKNTVSVSVRDLVEFILRSGDIDNRKKSGQDIQAMLEGAKIHRLIQQGMGSDYHSEVYLKEVISLPDFDIIVDGRADGIIYETGDGSPFQNTESDASDMKLCEMKRGTVPCFTIDEIKTMYLDLDRLKEPVPVHLAQARCYAYIFAKQNDLAEITVRMTYVNQTTLEKKYFHETYTWGEIKAWFEKLINDYTRWAQFEFAFKKIRNDSIGTTDFPFEYREGQKELVSQVYRTIYHGRKLFLQAPTGTGKTIATVFPAVKAMGEGLADRIFYLTAKTITRTVAADCFDILRGEGLRIKSVVITAKEKICTLEKPECNPDACPRAKGHYDRVNDAMYDLLTHEDSFTREVIEAYAERYNVCPFELCLDMSLFSDAIICDYNYVFDPNVYLRRFFADGAPGKYIFLVDEAHNLADRGMAMYSADLYKEDFLELKGLVKHVDTRLDRALGNTNRKLLSLKRECETFMVLDDISDIIMSLNRLMGRLETFLDEQEHFPQSEEVLDFYLKVRHFLNMHDQMGENDYRIYCEHVTQGDFKLKLLCVNPSESLKLRLLKGVSTIFFSATLLPVNYFKDMLGADPSDYAVYAHSIFDVKKRGLLISRDVSSKYTRRSETEYVKIAGYIHDICTAREGNYMVFFPSHAFLSQVLKAYELYLDTDGIRLLVQKINMKEEEREEFLSNFIKNDKPAPAAPDEDKLLPDLTGPSDCKILIGFCVMGGIFAEGIDLKNDSLIGAIIVGTGLPMVTNERGILKEAYESEGHDGFDYAYRYPGMNKVMQAAGRVIRTVDDVGIVALLDERFLTPPYMKLFPREWKDYEVCSAATAGGMAAEFWEGLDGEDPDEEALEKDDMAKYTLAEDEKVE